MMRNMSLRRTSIASLAFLPALSLVLAGCSEPDLGPEPLSEEALAAVTDNAGAPKEELARQMDELFTVPGQGETRAVLVMAGGKIAAERYGEGYSAETPMISWSMAKTITAVMIGMLVADGRLRLDESAPIALWQRPGDARGEITVRQLLQMRSGLRHTEAGDVPYESSEVRMLFLDGRDDMAKWAEEQPLEAEPGAQFEYSSNTTVILADVAARALTDGNEDPDQRSKAVRDYLDARLFGPLGMDSMVAEFDAAGTMIGGSLMHGNARDWAKFGEFLRRGGRAPGGEQLVPKGWIDKMLTPSPRAKHYGFQIWLNREHREVGSDEPHPLFPKRAPETAFSLIGHMGQYVVSSPSQQLTVVRLGHSDAKERQTMMGELADIFELYPVR